MKPYVAVIAMVNGMIGGLILELPILADQGGTLLSFIIILVTGFFSFYSCYLCILHLGEHDDLDSALVHHFGGKKCVKIFYDFLVSINLIFLLLLYYQLIVQQWICHETKASLVQPFGQQETSFISLPHFVVELEERKLLLLIPFVQG